MTLGEKKQKHGRRTGSQVQKVNLCFQGFWLPKHSYNVILLVVS